MHTGGTYAAPIPVPMLAPMAPTANGIPIGGNMIASNPLATPTAAVEPDAC